MGAETYALKGMGDGLWEVTIGPIRSGFHYYELVVDGHAMNIHGGMETRARSQRS
jgi:hypothetical protein